MSTRPSRILAACFTLAAAHSAHAATSCSSGDTNLSLGNYPGFSDSAVDATGFFIVTCTRSGGSPNTTVTVGLGPSLNSGSVANRQVKLSTGADLLNYNLYRDASRTSVWGQTGGVDTVSQSISLANKTSGTLTFSIYARIDARQDVHAGSYVDTVVITVNF